MRSAQRSRQSVIRFVGEQRYDIVDGVMRLWLTLAMGQNLDRNIAFRMLTR